MLVLRRAFAVVEALMAVVLVWLLGIEGLTARRVGGDGIATGIARAVAPSFIVIGVGLAAAAVATWRGTRRWWLWQIAVLLGAPVVLVVMLVFS